MSRSERASRIGPLYDGVSDSAVHQSYFGHISRGFGRRWKVWSWFFARRYWIQCHASCLLIGLRGVEWWARNDVTSWGVVVGCSKREGPEGGLGTWQELSVVRCAVRGLGIRCVACVRSRLG
jgi:hypothetical protein